MRTLEAALRLDTRRRSGGWKGREEVRLFARLAATKTKPSSEARTGIYIHGPPGFEEAFFSSRTNFICSCSDADYRVGALTLATRLITNVLVWIDIERSLVNCLLLLSRKS